MALSCNLPASTVAQYVVVVAQLPATNTSASELLHVWDERQLQRELHYRLETVHVHLVPSCAAATTKQLSTQQASRSCVNHTLLKSLCLGTLCTPGLVRALSAPS